MRFYQSRVKPVTDEILDWFQEHGREFPWRSFESQENLPEGAIHDPYVVFVSEMMLQQTQAARVAERLSGFLVRFPNVEALASADQGDLLREWKGMGYNRRALRLKEAATEIVQRYGGAFPADERLQELPGVGRYTASAIRSFAFGEDVPVVDVNIQRVLSRIFWRCYSTAQVIPSRTLERVARDIVPSGKGSRWHQALMDFGGSICTARSPKCSDCPLQEHCLSAGFPYEGIWTPAARSKGEPMLLGVPRRFVRGTIIDVLREASEPIPIEELLTEVEKRHQAGDDQREQLRKLVETLKCERMIWSTGEGPERYAI